MKTHLSIHIFMDVFKTKKQLFFLTEKGGAPSVPLFLGLPFSPGTAGHGGSIILVHEGVLNCRVWYFEGLQFHSPWRCIKK